MPDDSTNTSTTALTRPPALQETFPERFVANWWSQSGGAMIGTVVGGGTAFTVEMVTAALTYFSSLPMDARLVVMSLGTLVAACLGYKVGKSAATAAQTTIDEMNMTATRTDEK